MMNRKTTTFLGMLALQRRHGQIATLLTMFTAVCLILLMVMVNLGKVSLTKTHTSNAADAAVLAAGSRLSGGLNEMAVINDEMWGLTVPFLVTMYIPVCVSFYQVRQTWAGLFASFQMSQYVKMVTIGVLSPMQADTNATQFAFANSGIDVPLSESNSLTRFLDRKSPGDKYTWQDHQGGKNADIKVTNRVQVDTGGIPFVMFPAPALLVNIQSPYLYYGYGGCIYPGAPIAHNSTAQGDTVLDELGVAIQAAGGNVSAAVSQINAGLSGVSSTFLLGAANVSFNGIPEGVPGGGTLEPRATVSRLEPDTDLRLWHMRYGENGNTISSQAEGRVSGGIIAPLVSVPDYSTELTETK